MTTSPPPPRRLATDARLRSFGLSSTSTEALSPAARAAIVNVVERAARELCTDRFLDGPTGVAVNLLGDTTQLNAALAGPLVDAAAPSGVLAGLRLLPLDQTLCVHTLATEVGYLDLADSREEPAALTATRVSLDALGIEAYAGVAVEVQGVRIGTVCLYGSARGDAARRDAREAALRRYGSLLSQQLTEAARLAAENDALRAEVRGEDASAFGEGAIYRDREHAASWREVTAILGDLERSLAAAADDAVDFAACVLELDPRDGKVAVVAVSERAIERAGMRPCVLRAVGDDAPAAFWGHALRAGRDEPVHEEDTLATAAAAARLGTAPGAFDALLVASLPEAASRLGLAVLCTRAPRTPSERAVRRTFAERFAAIVANAQRTALAVFTSASTEDLPPAEVEVDDEVLTRVRAAFGEMKLRGLLALAEERGVPDAEEATSIEDLLRMLALHATRQGRERRAHLEALSVRELLAIGEAGALARVEAAETKREMVDAILDAEGLLGPAPATPLAPLPVPPRHVPAPSPEQRSVAFDPASEWVREAQQRVDESLPFSKPGAFSLPGLPRPPVPADEALRNAVFERLGLDDVRDLTPAEFASFDGVAAGAAAVAGAIFGAITLVHAEEQLFLGVTARDLFKPLLAGDLAASPRTTSACQYGVVKRAALAVVDMTAPEAGQIGAMALWDGAQMQPGFDVLPRSYLGVPLVTSEGVVLGNVCVIDDKPRPDFAENPKLLEQLEGLAAAVVNLFELRRLRRENAALNARRRLDVAAVTPLARPAAGGAPTDRVALLLTDIESSTELHERDPALMKRALDVHDAAMRRAIADNAGVEVTTEGDAFEVAFHSAADAIRCAFDAQLRLRSAPWPTGIEQLGTCTTTDEARALRGCRVRMTVHFAEAGGGLLGPRRFDVTRHAITRRPQYRGRVVDEARYVAEMASGGQVLVTQEAFDEVSLALTTALGDPRVVDLGRYASESLGDVGHVYELTPLALAARTFTPPIRVPRGARLLAPGFIHAPHTSPLVVAFVFPVLRTDEAFATDAVQARASEAFATAIRDCLAEHGGYEMKENQGAFMCAFAIDDAAQAVAFGAAVHAAVTAGAAGAFDCRVGITSGAVSVEPHVRTGRLEAYGPPCNRAARLAKSANPGQTLLDAGTAERAGGGACAVPLFDLGEHRFKGVEEPIHVLQAGDGFHPPIGSLGYQEAIVKFNQAPVGNVARTRALLAVMDAMGTDAFPKSPEVSLDRAYVREALERGLAARDEAMAAARVGASER